MKSIVHIVSVITVLSAPLISLVQSDPAQSRALVHAELLKLERAATALVTVTALPIPSGSKPASRAYFRKAVLSIPQAVAKWPDAVS